jgi:tetratricopeptide (TPR) repeat protein
VYVAQARIYMAREQFKEALAPLARGRYYERLGRLDAALTDINTLFNLQAGEQDALKIQARLLNQKGDYAGAQAALERLPIRRWCCARWRCWSSSRNTRRPSR